MRARARVSVPVRVPVRARAFELDAATVELASGLVGRGIVTFCIFYCSANWAYYRKQRKDLEAFYTFQRPPKDPVPKKKTEKTDKADKTDKDEQDSDGQS